MSKQNDGGPAFPRPQGPCVDGGCSQEQVGMSLRDWFAGQVLMGMQSSGLADTAYRGVVAKGANKKKASAVAAEIMSALSYQLADAMLAAKNGGAA